MVNDLAQKMLAFLVSLILPLVTGYLIKRLIKIPKEKFDILIKINIALFSPIAVILTFWNISFTKEMIFLPIIGLVIPIIGGVFGYLFSKKRYDSSRKRGSYIISAMLSNRLSVGGLSAYIMFGELAYIYVNLILLLNVITNFVIGHPLGNYYGRKDQPQSKTTLKSIVLRITNIGIVAILIGIALNMLGIVRPDSVKNMVDQAIKISAWTALLPIGASIEFGCIKKYYRDIPSMFLIKFILLPVIAAGIAIPLLHDTVAIATVIILAMSPVAINAVVVAKMNNLDEGITISAFIVTSVFFIMIIFPIMLFVMPHFVV